MNRPPSASGSTNGPTDRPTGRGLAQNGGRVQMERGIRTQAIAIKNEEDNAFAQNRAAVATPQVPRLQHTSIFTYSRITDVLGVYEYSCRRTKYLHKEGVEKLRGARKVSQLRSRSHVKLRKAGKRKLYRPVHNTPRTVEHAYTIQVSSKVRLFYGSTMPV